MRKYLPFIIVEIYLLFTIFLFFCGPIDFSIHNFQLFIGLLFLYHLSFATGYLVFSSWQASGPPLAPRFSEFKYYFSLFFAVMGTLLTYHNLTLGSSLVPGEILNNVIRGVNAPGEAYTARMEELDGGKVFTARWLNVSSIFFMFMKYLFIFYFIYYWRDLGFVKRLISISYCFVFLSPGLAAGINSVNFHFFIYVSAAVLILLYVNGYSGFRFVVIFCSVLALIPIGFFGYLMSQRGGGFDYFMMLSPYGDIGVSMDTPSLDSFFGFYIYAFVWLVSYLVQGYYGFSLALGEAWSWTYGFGGSKFLQNNFYSLTGIDISSLTFQSKITHVWDESVQWHSFYSQVANDVGFVGVAFVMFFLGGLLARVWMSVIYRNSFYGAAFLPILAILFIFIPANNQVFGSIDTVSYFVAVMFLWVFEGKIKKVKSGIF